MSVPCVYVYVCLRGRAQDGKRGEVCVCICQRSDVIGVSCLTLLEEAGSVERWGPPVSPVFIQAPAHENVFR